MNRSSLYFRRKSTNQIVQVMGIYPKTLEADVFEVNRCSILERIPIEDLEECTCEEILSY